MNKHKELYAKHFQHKEEKWKDLLHKVEQLDLDSLISLQDRILDELSIEIEEYLNPEFRNSRSNNAVNQFYSADETHIETVLCPLCQNGRLSLDSTILTCSSCHLHLDTQTDSLNLTTIGNSLLDAQTKHQTSGCPYALHAWLIDQNANSQSFVQNNIDENGNLYKPSTDIVTLLCIGCDQCSFMEVVV
ncbi:hypothetical protein KSF78_0008044 [Schistosoma japonicum]|nr:hypothetical protein KSF78_0008044 [Schistosoma japonicum]KAH8873494.1 hypothetical protein KSF78_0008044 [Schistosoma japonicum]KAH8873497.1 hypothetical protein KSF78_0008044 [Schistosoma japonicum]